MQNLLTLNPEASESNFSRAQVHLPDREKKRAAIKSYYILCSYYVLAKRATIKKELP